MLFPLIKVKYTVNNVTLTRIVGTSPGDALYINKRGSLAYVDLFSGRSTEPTKEFPDGFFKFTTEKNEENKEQFFVSMMDISQIEQLEAEDEKRMFILREMEKTNEEHIEEDSEL